MFTPLPQASEMFEQLDWSKIEPWYRELTAISLTQETLAAWMAQWSWLSALLDETMWRHEIATTANTADEERAQRKARFLEEVFLPAQALDQQIKEQLLASGLEPENFAIPLRNLRAEAEFYRKENLPLLKRDRELSDAYYALGGGQMVMWEGKEIPNGTLFPVMEQDLERGRRERAWHAVFERCQADREHYQVLWSQKIRLRQQIARNAGYEQFREYRWQQLHRFDYTPADCKAFHETFERVVMPISRQLWEKKRQLLGVETLRPWDMRVNAHSHEPVPPVTNVHALLSQCASLFHLIDPQLGGYYETMLQEGCFDLEERAYKAHVGYSQPLEVKHLPFIFGHLVSLTDVVTLLLHECGHAFHVFETASLPYIQQRHADAVPLEFAEVASTSMELIGAMYLHQAGLCSKREVALIHMRSLEQLLMINLPSLILGDAFQHWVSEQAEQAENPEACNQKWAELTRRYLPALDWSGLEMALGSGWQQEGIFYSDPFYYIEYAFAIVGALRIWENYLRDPQATLHQYRSALSLGATRTIPELYETAGVRFVFDEETLRRAMELIVRTVRDLEGMV